MAVAWNDVVPDQYWSPLNYSARLYDQHFGMGISKEDLHEHTYYNGFLIRPRTRESVENSGVSEVIDDHEQFKAILDVRHFTRPEITVRGNNNIVEVHGQHADKTDNYGTIRRTFCRKYLLPLGVTPGSVTSDRLDSGILIIRGPKQIAEPIIIDVNIGSDKKDTEEQDVEMKSDKDTATTDAAVSS